MAFGIYIHIPHCLQICPYCDFAKYEWTKILPPEAYVNLVIQEIRLRHHLVPRQDLDTVYFGGGTPSLLEPKLIVAILDELANSGFKVKQDAEVTIEINPGTVDQVKLDGYRAAGINRFSVGAQTFNPRLLKIAGRKHSADETRETLSRLHASGVNYSFDLLFGLPTQNLAELNADIEEALRFDPSHLSAYCLTVSEQHPMNRGRAPEEEQAEMYIQIEESLAAAGLHRYEISNYAKAGRESRHNLLYWQDQPYWGIGLSSHSYLPTEPWGARFWNPPSLKIYQNQIEVLQTARNSFLDLPANQYEGLKQHQALTDFCHTSLRRTDGLSEDALLLKFPDATAELVIRRLNSLIPRELVAFQDRKWSLSKNGRLVADVVFQELTFLADELPTH